PLLREVSEPQKKGLYAPERILLGSAYSMRDFKDDPKGRASGFEGFHIYGPCPDCGHQTSGTLPAKYLSEDGGKLEDDAPAGSQATRESDAPVRFEAVLEADAARYWQASEGVEAAVAGSASAA